jgi:hypothetical protein
MGWTFRTGACALAWVLAAGEVLGAGQAMAAPRCAKDNEVTAIQASAIQQQLMVAALTCHAIEHFNAFQTGFSSELRRSDADLMKMFKRFYGGRKGETEYHAFKTRLANDSSMRSIHDNQGYCAAAETVFAAALSPQKPTLTNFVSGVQVQESSPFDSCNIRVAVSFSGAIPDIIPRPKPVEFGGTALVQSAGDQSPIWKKPEGTASVAYPGN